MVRKASFLARAARSGVAAQDAEQLWAIAGAETGGAWTSPDDHLGILFDAAHRASRGAGSAFYVDVKVEGLAALNRQLGHAGADARMQAARDGMFRRLATLASNVQPMANVASSFGFLVEGSPELSEDGLAQRVRTASEDCREEFGLELSGNVMSADDAAASGVARALARDASASKARDTGGKPTPRGTAARFTSSGSDRRRRFRAAAESLGVSAETASELYEAIPTVANDALTGFERGTDRASTMVKAAAHCGKTGTPGIYVEVDVRNLGGLNRELGREKADEVLARIAALAESSMAGLASESDVLPFRHGGDEFSFIVVGRRPGSSSAGLEIAVASAMRSAELAIRAATMDVAHVQHTKRAGAGTGIVWGTATIEPGKDPSAVFAVADRKVESKKDGTLTEHRRLERRFGASR